MYKSATANRFITAFTHAARHRTLIETNCASIGSVEDWQNYSCYLEEDGNSGYAIKHFDDELCFVFSMYKGRGAAIVADACTRGAVRLNCFDGYLPELYKLHGFEESSRVANWNSGGPDVVYMRRQLF